MRLAVICFTRQGSILCRKLVKRFTELGEACCGYAKPHFLNDLQEQPGLIPMEHSLEEWTRDQFDRVDGLIFIGAAGIAVRAVAPFLRDKLTDPAVVSVDEAGRFAISLLSGHVGGANALTRMTAAVLGAQPVITTASDVRGMTAVDVWAGNRGLILSDRRLAKETAAALLDGENVGFYSDYPITGSLPDGVGKGEICRQNVWVTCHVKPEADHMISLFLSENSQVLRLIPSVLFVGIGCRRDTPEDTIRHQVEQVLTAANLELRAVAGIASVEIKKDEAGIVCTARKLGVAFNTYPAKELEELEGDFTASPFVKKVTGTDNVCERAALMAAGRDGRILVRKQAGSGVTVAVASRNYRVEETQVIF